MVFTNAGKQFVAWRLGSALNTSFISNIGIGDGSGTGLVTNTTLVNERLRTNITGSPDFSTSRKVVFQGDFNSVQMSGINLSEFGLFTSGAAGIGSTWQRESFGSIVFDGTNELQITSALEVL